MKMPKEPPEWQTEIIEQGDFRRLLQSVPNPSVKGKYLHWDDLVHKKPPANLSHEQWWCMLKFHRLVQTRSAPLVDKRGKQFEYLLPDPVPENLHFIDMRAGGRIQMPEPITNPHSKDRYYVGSLIEEAIPQVSWKVPQQRARWLSK
jgi:hypothetical protein